MTKTAPQSNWIERNELYDILVRANFSHSSLLVSLSKWSFASSTRMVFCSRPKRLSEFALRSIWIGRVLLLLSRAVIFGGSVAVLQFTTEDGRLSLVFDAIRCMCVCVCVPWRSYVFHSCPHWILEGTSVTNTKKYDELRSEAVIKVSESTNKSQSSDWVGEKNQPRSRVNVEQFRCVARNWRTNHPNRNKYSIGRDENHPLLKWMQGI